MNNKVKKQNKIKMMAGTAIAVILVSLVFNPFSGVTAFAASKSKKHNTHHTNSSNHSSKYIGTEKAKTIAFDHSKVKSNDVRKLECDLDNEHGKTVYEIDFKCGKMEYEYVIDAVTGEILDWESERD